ncbi:MAG: hypothetical protein QOJ16_175 [Acidobacteriota bacterium]|nr:hypothetical protein [Acidobacteriota bacterium]
MSARRIGETLSWGLLAALLLATLWAALRFDRAGRPSLVGDEATYAMQAASLAWDGDLAYSRADYERFVRQWGGKPDGLVLQSRDQGRHITYGKPFLYALAIAPFVRFAPVRGALVGNALFLAAAALLAARTLRQRLGGAAPFWVAVLVFGSVSFAYVYWVHADIFLFAAMAAGLALVYWEDRPGEAPPAEIYEEEETAPRWRFLLRWAVAGALLAIPGAFRPFYLALLLPAALAALSGWRRRRTALVTLFALVAGALGLLLLTGLVQWHAGGAFSGYGGERQGFYPRTGYPDVDFPASGWEASVRRWGNTSWTQEGAIDPYLDGHLWAWNALYFVFGRNIGVLPYFLPLALGFFAFSGRRGRWALPLAILLAAGGFLLVRPFNFYGGGGAIGNRYFLPLYPALWFLAARPLRAWTASALAAVTGALAAPFLLPLWQHPTAFPIGPDGRYRHVSEVAVRNLPYETTQSHIPGGQDSAHDGLWVKLLNDNMGRIGEAESLMGDAVGEVLVGSPERLRGLLVVCDPRAPTRLESGGQTLRPSLLRPNGTVVFAIDLGKPKAVHPMWWTREPYYLYQVDLRLPGAPKAPIGVRLLPQRDLIKMGGE